MPKVAAMLTAPNIVPMMGAEIFAHENGAGGITAP
jgi:hypothetical protein